MVRIFFILLCFVFLPFFGNEGFKQKLSQAQGGDYIVTEQGGNYSVWIIRYLQDEKLLIEEVVVRGASINPKKINWKLWVEQGADKAQSWTAMGFNLRKNQLTQCFSFLDRSWIFLSETDAFIGKLLSLSFIPTAKKDRKRIGPKASNPKEIDRRRLWKPQLIRNGKKVKGANFDVIRSTWPLDKSRLEGCIIEAYFDADLLQFPFPYWMEVQHPHFTFKVRAIDSGKNLRSPMPLLQLK